ncbi:MAG TPA: acetyl-coenzyme A synthetase, partial [Cytophagales bacterium]|nr:acetyl-coenzyme A synthetase [Cytophagales bacterium]
FESVPTYPKADRNWQIVEQYKVNIFYTAPTVIRSLMRESIDLVNSHDLSSLRLLGSVGEPINPEVW